MNGNTGPHGDLPVQQSHIGALFLIVSNWKQLWYKMGHSSAMKKKRTNYWPMQGDGRISKLYWTEEATQKSIQYMIPKLDPKICMEPQKAPR